MCERVTENHRDDSDTGMVSKIDQPKQLVLLLIKTIPFSNNRFLFQESMSSAETHNNRISLSHSFGEDQGYHGSAAEQHGDF